MIAPVRDWGMTRAEEIAYAGKHGIVVPVRRPPLTPSTRTSGTLIECGVLEDPWTAPPDDRFCDRRPAQRPTSLRRSASPSSRACPSRSTASDAVEELIARARHRRGARRRSHRHGREPTRRHQVPRNLRGASRDAPAFGPRRARDLTRQRDLCIPRTSSPPVRHPHLQRALVLAAARRARRVRRRDAAGGQRRGARAPLQGPCAGRGRPRPVSLYDHGLATYEEGDAFQHGAAAGFIHIWSLPTKTWAASRDGGGHDRGMTAPEPQRPAAPAAAVVGAVGGGARPRILARLLPLAAGRPERSSPYDVRASRVHVAHAGAAGPARPPPMPSAPRRARRARAADRPTRPTRTSTPTSSGSSSSGSARSAGACTRVARATTRSAVATRLWARDACRALAGGVAGCSGARRRRGGGGATRSCRATRTCSGHSPSCSATSWPRMPGRSRATRRACAAPTPPPTSPRSAPVRWRARACRSIRSGAHRARLLAHLLRTLDAVSDRDFVCDLLYACALGFVHLSRLAEDVVIFTSQEFGLAELDDRVAMGSLDDAAEEEPAGRRAPARPGGHRDRAPDGLPRRASRACRSPTTPTCRRTRRRCSGRSPRSTARSRPPRCWCGAALRAARAAAAADDGWCVATDVAEALVREGVPFREAHDRVAGRVAAGERLSEPTPAEAVAARRGPGGSRPSVSPSSSPRSTRGCRRARVRRGR